MASPNQKIVYIGNRVERDATHPYTEQSIEAMAHAARELSGDRFKVWMYLSKNRDDFVLELSQKDLLKWGVKKDTYQRAVNDLIELGYLVQIDEKRNEWRFEEFPEEVKMEEKPAAVATKSDGGWDF